MANGELLTVALRQACMEAGSGTTDDHNGAHGTGFERWETIFPNGRRHNTAAAYLELARTRRNLRIITGAAVHRIAMDLVRTGPLAPRTEEQLISPAANDDELAAYIDVSAGLSYHPVGTVRMGGAKDAAHRSILNFG